MDSSTGGCGSPAPFLLKTYDMVDDPSTACIVSWSNTGCSFVVWNSLEFSRDLLPKYFKHSNFSSFIRQLNTYGFRKVDPDRWEFSNCYFIKGQSHLLTNIRRRKPVHCHSGSQGNSVAVTVSERGKFEEEIERLKHEKRSLESAVDKLKFENERYRNQIKLLAQMLIKVDQGQSLMLEKPYYMEQLESLKRKRRILAYKEVNPSVTLPDNIPFSSPRSHTIRDVDNADSSREIFGHGMNLTSSLDSAMSGDSDSSVSRDSCSNIATSSRHTDSPKISSTLVGKHKFCESNVKDIKHDEDESIALLLTATNDVFWEQFLTEAPVSSIPQKVQTL